MAKLKSFETAHYYIANYGNGDRSSSKKYSVNISNYGYIKNKIKDFIKEDNPLELQKLLQSEFIYPEVIRSYTETPHNTFSDRWNGYYSYGRGNGNDYSWGNQYTYYHNPSYGTGQRDDYSYEEHYTAPVLQELLLNHKEDFIKLLSSASKQCQAVLMNFTGLDLTDVDISDLDTTQANFTSTVLQKTVGVSQELLDKSLTYYDAVLPKGISPFWTKEKAAEILRGIAQLKSYGEYLLQSCDDEGVSKGDKAVKLAISLRGMIESTTKYNGGFQKQFLQKLHQHDTDFNHRRYYGLKMIISNIALFVLGLGVGYLAAGLINYSETGRFLFFSQPETEQNVANINAAATPSLA